MEERLRRLATGHLAGAMLQRGLPVRSGPVGLLPLHPAMTVQGPARPVRCRGSMEVFLEAIERAEPGQVLVVDDAGRDDEACVGDLGALEAEAAGLAGIVVWGRHRDTARLAAGAFPIFSLGPSVVPPRPRRRRSTGRWARPRVGGVRVRPADWVVGDADGVLFVGGAHLESLVAAAERIRDTEHRQADELADGRPLREQRASLLRAAGLSTRPPGS